LGEVRFLADSTNRCHNETTRDGTERAIVLETLAANRRRRRASGAGKKGAAFFIPAGTSDLRANGYQGGGGVRELSKLRMKKPNWAKGFKRMRWS